jgi:DNA-binding SARP family transcriptional activator
MSLSTHDKVAELLYESRNLEQRGQIGAALRKAKDALIQAKGDNDADETALALQRIARLHFRQGHYSQTRRLAHDVLKYACEASPTRAEAFILLGLCAAETDDPISAEKFFHQAIDLSREIDYPRGLVRALHNLSATVYVPRGQFTLALAADEESLNKAREYDLGDAVWFPLATMGWIYWTTRQWERAFITVDDLRQVALPNSLAEGYACCLQADLAQDRDSASDIPMLYARARSIAETIGDPGLGVLARLGLSRYHLNQGDPPAASDWAEDALALARRVGYYHLQGMALISRARAFWRNENDAQTIDDLSAAIETLTSVSAYYDLAQAYLLLAILFHKLDHPKAEETWLEAIARINSRGYIFLLERERALAFPLLAHYINHSDPDVATLSARLLTQLERVPPPPLDVRTLGDFTVHQGQRTIPSRDWRARRAGELFRLLLLAPRRTLLREQVIECLWPGKSPDAALSLFHRATSALRRVLEPDLPEKFPSRYLSVERGRVTLNLPPGSRVDFEIFEKHVQNQEWESALKLYRSFPFPTDRYADWVVAKREHLNFQAVKAALGAARQALENGNPFLALEASLRALEIDPWQEQAVLLGMRANVALNNRPGAIRLYQQLERTLQEDLDIAPKEDLRRFYDSLLENT